MKIMHAIIFLIMTMLVIQISMGQEKKVEKKITIEKIVKTEARDSSMCPKCKSEDTCMSKEKCAKHKSCTYSKKCKAGNCDSSCCAKCVDCKKASKEKCEKNCTMDSTRCVKMKKMEKKEVKIEEKK